MLLEIHFIVPGELKKTQYLEKTRGTNKVYDVYKSYRNINRTLISKIINRFSDIVHYFTHNNSHIAIKSFLLRDTLYTALHTIIQFNKTLQSEALCKE